MSIEERPLRVHYTNQEITMKTFPKPQRGLSTLYTQTPTTTVDVGGARFAFRQLGADTGVPVIFFNHLAAVLDNWDPRVVDGIAARHRVITFDNRGVGASQGSTPDSVAAMARDAVAFIRALGFDQVDLVGFSMGGFVAQVIAQEEPQLVRKIVLAGTGPAGGEGIDNFTSVTIRDMIKGALTFKDPKQYLFFTTTANGRSAAREFLKRLKERTVSRDKPISLIAFRAQLKAIHAWGRQEPSDLTGIQQPVQVINGDADKMVPSSNSVDLAWTDLYVSVLGKGADSGLSCAVTLACELSSPSSQAPGGRLNGSVWIPPYRPVAPAC